MSTLSPLSGFPISTLPTPPVSPEHPSEILRSIIAHYQRERMWIKHTQDVIAFAKRNHSSNHPALDIKTPVSVNKHNNTPLWKRRKAATRLHLNDLSAVKLSNKLLAHDAYGPRILQLFAALLEARIESCKRVDVLITQALQRRHLVYKQHYSW